MKEEEQEIARLKEQIAYLRETLRQSWDHKEALGLEVQAANKEIAKLKNDLAHSVEKADEDEREILKLREEIKSHAWEISPAMAQAKIDEQAREIADLKARLAEAEKRYRDLDDYIEGYLVWGREGSYESR